MNNLNKVLAATAAFSFVLLNSLAWANSAVELIAKAEIEVEVAKDNGEIEIKRVPAGKVVPGNDVIYTITAKNTSNEPVSDVVITDPIPQHMAYRADSATGAGTAIVFSADNGSTYDVPEKLVVVDEDGSVRAAAPSEYTHVQWKFTQELAPGASKSVRFYATLQ